jgi:hypothetical protein
VGAELRVLEKEGMEEKGRREGGKEGRREWTHDLRTAVYRPAVESCAPLRCVLHLESRLDVFDGRRDEAHGPPSSDARESMTGGWQLRMVGEEKAMQLAAVQG